MANIRSGMNFKQIADIYKMPYNTFRNHMKDISDKLYAGRKRRNRVLTPKQIEIIKKEMEKV